MHKEFDNDIKHTFGGRVSASHVGISSGFTIKPIIDSDDGDHLVIFQKDQEVNSEEANVSPRALSKAVSPMNDKMKIKIIALTSKIYTDFGIMENQELSNLFTLVGRRYAALRRVENSDAM